VVPRLLSGCEADAQGGKRTKRDLHALNEDGMVLCNPRDKEAARRAEMEGIATEGRAAVTCRKCLALLYARDRAGKEGRLFLKPTLERQVGVDS
jgi:hypothetical protein